MCTINPKPTSPGPACGQAVRCGVCDTPEFWRAAAGLCARVRACAGAAEYLHAYTTPPELVTLQDPHRYSGLDAHAAEVLVPPRNLPRITPKMIPPPILPNLITRKYLGLTLPGA